MAAMTANLPDSKTWSIVAGSLPAGLALGSSDGVISGRPATPGTYSFTVRALIADGRSDTKALTLEVRDRLTVTGSGDLETRVARTEVGVAFEGGLFATGGFGTYTWSVDGDLPLGLELAEDGTISGKPTEAGTYRFTVSVTDAESRRALYAARLIVAERLAIKSALLKPAKVGRFMSRKVATFGGVAPVTTKLKRGPLPKGSLLRPPRRSLRRHAHEGRHMEDPGRGHRLARGQGDARRPARSPTISLRRLSGSGSPLSRRELHARCRTGTG